MKVFILMAVLAYATAYDAGCCTMEDRREVMALYQSIWHAGMGNRITVAGAVFADLFEHHPETKPLFSGVDVDHPKSDKFKAHCVRVINGLDTAINMLDNPSVLNAHLDHLGKQHAARNGIKGKYFTYIGESFDRVFKHVIPCFNADAFGRCFAGLAAHISESLE